MKAPTPAAVLGTKVLLKRIVIECPPGEKPTIMLHGDVIVRDPRVGRVSEARVTTHYMPPIGKEFIAEMEEAFAGAPPEQQRRVT